jgi:hypothetical protein
VPSPAPLPTSEAVTKAPVTASEAGKPTLDPRAWVMSTPQEREAFVKAVGRRDLEDAFNAIEPGYALTRGSMERGDAPRAPGVCHRIS